MTRREINTLLTEFYENPYHSFIFSYFMWFKLDNS